MGSPDQKPLFARRAVSEAGRRTLAAAVSTDHNWDYPFSGVDKFIAALDDLADADLDPARLHIHYLEEALTCVWLARTSLRDAAQDVDENTDGDP
jgi:hypothetical protein